jgi:uncharacterized protein YxjI
MSATRSSRVGPVLSLSNSGRSYQQKHSSVEEMPAFWGRRPRERTAGVRTPTNPKPDRPLRVFGTLLACPEYRSRITPAMSARFCTACGKPLAADARFCGSCGAAVGEGQVGAPGTPALREEGPTTAPGSDAVVTTVGEVSPPMSQGPAPAGPADRAVPADLGLGGVRDFLLQQESFSDQWNYRVLTKEGRYLFGVRGSLLENVMANLSQLTGSRPPPATSGDHKWLRPIPPLRLSWTITDAGGAPWGKISGEVGRIPGRLSGNRIVFTVSGLAEVPLLAVSAELTGIGRLSAAATYPDGRAMFSARGNTLGHDFSLLDPSGGEVARIHRAWASLRDSYGLEVLGDVDPLAAIVFAILIERAEVARRGGGPRS